MLECRSQHPEYRRTCVLCGDLIDPHFLTSLDRLPVHRGCGMAWVIRQGANPETLPEYINKERVFEGLS